MDVICTKLLFQSLLYIHAILYLMLDMGSFFLYFPYSSKCELGKKNSVMTNTNENCIYNWLAPEVMFNLPPSFYCDMFSFCVVLWELFHGK